MEGRVKGEDEELLDSTGPLGEMAIVDTFTKLIFGEDDEFSPSEKLIVDALRMVDNAVVLDSYQEMGIYLRALGVAEMIQLVSRVQDCLANGMQALVNSPRETSLDRRAR